MTETLSPHIVRPERIVPFFLGGKAEFTIMGTTHRFTYKVVTPMFDGEPHHNKRFVYIFDGHSNEGKYAYTYIGIIKLNESGDWAFEFRQNRRNLRYKRESREVYAFEYVFNLAKRGKFDNRVEVWHVGRCCHCGRKLTVPEACELGIGIRCLAKLKKLNDPFQPIPNEAR